MKDLHRLGSYFNTLCKRFALPLLLGTATLPAVSQNPETDPPADSTKIRYVESMSPAQLKAADAALIQHARDNFANLAPLMKNDYSRRLDQLADETNAYLKNYGFKDKRVFVYDPLLFDAFDALKIPGADSTKGIADSPREKLLREIIKSNIDQTAYSALGDASPHILRSYQDPVDPNTDIITITAHADVLQNTEDKPLASIAPAPPHAVSYIIGKLTQEQTINFINKHEAWHCKDLLLRLSENLFLELPGGSLETKFTKEEGEYKGAIIAYIRESLGDVGAVGDMIREGADPKIIDILIEARAARYVVSTPSDENDRAIHMSPPALVELKRRIGETGLDEFRALTDEQTRDFYLGVLKETVYNPVMMEKHLHYARLAHKEIPRIETKSGLLDKIANGAAYLPLQAVYGIRNAINAGRRGHIEAESATDIETRKMLELEGYLGRTDMRPISKLLGADILTTNAALKDWHPGEALYDRAMKDDGKITPLTVIRAYGAVQDDIIAGMNKDSTPQGLAIGMRKLDELRTFLIEHLSSESYLGINAERGINLLETEPCLAVFAPPRLMETRISISPPPVTPVAVK